MPTLKIIVEGRPNSGKTVVSLIIERALKAAGFDVEFRGELELEDRTTIRESSPEMLEKLRPMLDHLTSIFLKRKLPTKINIVNRQTSRVRMDNAPSKG